MGTTISTGVTLEKGVEISPVLHTECTNLNTLGGWNIEEFDHDALYLYLDPDDSKIYCFPKIDRGLIEDNINPYTGKPFDKNVKEQLIKLRIAPPSSFYSRRMCPIFRNTKWIVFVTKSKRYGGYYIVDKVSGYSARRVYMAMLKSPRVDNENLFKRERFSALRKVYDGHSSIIRDRRIPKIKGVGLMIVSDPPIDFDVSLLRPSDLFLELQAYMSNSGLALSKGSSDILQAQNIRLDIPVTVYRGFNFPRPHWIDISVDDVMEIDDKTPASSWSSNICIAEYFASGAGKGIGYVVEYEAQPEEVVIDTRLLEKKVLDSLTETGADQSEILLDKRRRKVKLVMIMKNGEYVKSIVQN